jgi:hypothetical protein
VFMMYVERPIERGGPVDANRYRQKTILSDR